MVSRTSFLALSVLALVVIAHASPLPMITARAPKKPKGSEDDDDDTTSAGEPTQVTVWQRPDTGNKAFKSASNLIFPKLKDFDLTSYPAGAVKGVKTVTTKMKGQSDEITATFQVKLNIDDDSYKETARIKGGGKHWEDVLDCDVTDESKGTAECVLKHYAEGDSDTLELTATDMTMHTGKMQITPFLNINTKSLAESASSLYGEYSSFTAND